MSLRILNPDDVDRYLAVYELEVDLPSWERTCILQGLALAREEATAGAETVDPGVAWSVRRAVHDRAATRCEYCLGPSSTRSVGARTRRRAELDHMLSRYGLAAVGATWETIHHPLNLCSACAGCNSEKGTLSLPPSDLERMWGALGVDPADPAAPLLAFYAQLLEARRFHIRRFAPTPQTAPGAALGAFQPERDYGGSPLLRHHPDRLEFVEAVYGEPLASAPLAPTPTPRPRLAVVPPYEHDLAVEDMHWGELASDDNRDMWR